MRGKMVSRKDMLRALFAFAFFFISYSHAFSFPLNAKDDLGRFLEIVHQPERIISLSPSHTEILFALGLDRRVVGVTDYCNYPKKAMSKAQIGGFAMPDVDRIIALRPDLVLAFGTIQIPAVRTLEEKGVSVFWLYPRTMEETLASFERIGEIAGAGTSARKLKCEVEGKIHQVRERLRGIATVERPGIFRVMGMSPLGTVGGLSFQSDLYRAAGGRNVFEDRKEDFFLVSLEEVKGHNPDVIVVCGEDPEKSARSLKKQKGWQDIKAVSEDRILVLPCDLICRPGPHVGEAIERVASFLFPDRFSSLPQRIVSLVPAVTEQLFLLEMADEIVGVTTYCQRPPQAQTKEKVGTVIDVNIEKIIELRPDLVIASRLTDRKQIRKLRGLGLSVEVFDAPVDFQGLCESFLALSSMVGKEQKAREVLASAKTKLETVRQDIQGVAKRRVFVQIGANPLFTANGDSFINDVVEYAGGINIAGDAKTGIFSREEVIERNPDIILVVTMGIVGEKEKEVWLRYKTMNAIKNRRIFTVDSNRVCSPTPVTFVETVKELVRIFHAQQ